MDDKIFVPYNPEWAERFDAEIMPIAEKVFGRARTALTAYITAQMPRAKTVEEWKEPGKYCRRVRVPHRRSQIVAYTYKTKSVELYDREGESDVA